MSLCKLNNYLVLQVTDLRITSSILFISHRDEGTSVTFVCLALTQHTFVGQSGLSRALAVELLDKVNNPDHHAHYSEGDDDDFEVGLKNFLRFLMTLEYILLFQLLLLLLLLPLWTRYHAIPVGLGLSV